MKTKFLLAYLFIGISSVTCSGKNETQEKDTKDKRQIDYHQTSINPHQQQQQQQQEPTNRVDTIYGSHPNQFVIQTIGQPLREIQQRQQHSHNNVLQQQQLQQQQQQPEQTAEVSQQYAYFQELQPIQTDKHLSKNSRKNSLGKSSIPIIAERQHQPQYVQQYQQPIQQIQPIHLLNPQEELLKFLQDEIATRALSLANSNVKRPQDKPVAIPRENNPKQGHGGFRNIPVRPENQEPIFTYVQENLPQAYYQPIPIDYHKSIPNHPLAASTLEKELEKLVASNKPHQQVAQISQPQAYKSPKAQQQTAATFSAAAPSALVPTAPDKFFSFFPDFAQLSGFKPTGELYYNEQLQEQPKAYPSENTEREREQKPRKVSSSNSQYLIEKQKHKSPHQTQVIYQQKPQYNSQQQKDQHQSYVHPSPDNRNAVMKIIEAPSLNYEKSQVNPTPIVSYYKAESTERPESVIQVQQKLPPVQPSTSTIFVSQGTGIHRLNPQPSQSTRTFNVDKQVKLPQLPPLDGKPITQEEFQALVDAGYPVQAVPVPVPVPYETFVRQLPHTQPQISEEHLKNQRKQNRPQKQAVTYLHPVRLHHQQSQQHQEQERNYAQRT